VLVLVIAFAGAANLRTGFGVLYGYLPLTLPVLSVVMAIAFDPRDLNTLEGWVRLTNAITLGLVAFAIWYFVASQGAGPYVRVGDERVLKTDYSLILVMLSFVWAGFCSVLGVVAARIPGATATGFQHVRLLNFWLSVAFLVSPVAFFQTKQDAERELGRSLDVRTFAVSIPYRDPALNLYIGRSTAPLNQVSVYRDIRATTATAAIDSALVQFRSSPEYWQFRASLSRGTQEGDRRPVEIQSEGIVAQERR
jgi:hypothetical protein